MDTHPGYIGFTSLAHKSIYQRPFLKKFEEALLGKQKYHQSCDNAVLGKAAGEKD